MRIDWWTLGLQTVNLLVLLWILGRYLFRPMAKIVAERQAASARLLDDAAAARAKAQEATQSAQAERDAAAAARAGLIDAAHKDAEAQRATLLEAARQEAAKQRAEAQAAIERMRGEERARIDHRASALATDIAARLLEGPAADLPVSAFLGGLEQALAALPETTRTAIRAADAPLALTSARALGADDLAAARAAIARALGSEVALAATVDPSLIAGLRLTTDTAVIDANLRADLDRVLAGLNGHDG